MWLEFVRRCGHVVSKEKFARNQPVKAMPVNDRLCRWRVIGMIKRELNFRAIKVAKPSFGDTRVVCENHFESIARLYSPESGLDSCGPDDFAILVHNPRARVVSEKWPGVMAKDHLLGELKTLDPGVFAMAATPPSANKPGKRCQVWMEVGWEFKCHGVSVGQPNLVKCRHE